MSVLLPRLRSSDGFTLVEMLVVITLIGIIAVIGYPAVQETMRKYNFRAASREVLTTVMQARSNAVRDNASWNVTFDRAANSFDLIDSNGVVNQSHDLSSYGNGIHLITDAETSCGAATANWNGDPIAHSDVISFVGRGFGSNDSIFIENENNDVCFAVTATGNGVVRLRRYNGKTPYANANWN